MPLPSSRIVQNQTNPRAVCQPERTGTAQHHSPNLTRATLTTRKPRARSLLTRLLTKRAGAKTSYNLVTYSSIEWAPWVRIRNKKTRWLLCFTRPLGLSDPFPHATDALPSRCLDLTDPTLRYRPSHCPEWRH